ncbi:MAG: putative toxin-antitoxin system toxin component, PIN family [Leptospirales bacterium]
MKIILDTNVIISASVFGGLSADILSYCYERHEVYISEFILDEFHRVLKEKLKVPDNLIASKIISFQKNLNYVVPDNPIPDLCSDKDDNPICQLALYVNADYIITGDKEFQKVNNIDSTRIISPREFWIHKDNQIH